jgi:ABC-type dipeptide/oligopeptide/nickel transport system permease component
MLTFILKRLGYGFLIVIGVVVVVFFLFYALPGDPVTMIVGPHSDEATRKAIKEDLGLDKPLPEQLYLYLRDLSLISVHKDTPKESDKYGYARIVAVGENVLVLKAPYLRKSFQTQRKVSEILYDRIWLTIILALTAMLFATIVGISLGVVAALKQNTWIDHTIISGSVIGVSVPSFVAAMLVSMFFGYKLNIGLNGIGSLWELDANGTTLHLENLILPAFTLGIRPLAIIAQLTRSSMLDVLSQDFIRTAKAKGVSKFNVVIKHALKNALNPVVTAISGWLASLMAGAFFVEYIFDYKGIGFETIRAVDTRDLNVIMAASLIIAVIFIIINIIVDLLYAYIDPRVRIK